MSDKDIPQTINESILSLAQHIVDTPKTEEEAEWNKTYAKSCAMIVSCYRDIDIDSFPTTYEKISAYLKMLEL